MQNWIQKGDVVAVTAPVGGVTSGSGLLVDSLFGVCLFDAAETEEVEIQTTGVVELPKAADAVTVGVRLYWDDVNKVLTITDTANTLIGVAVAAAAGGDATVRVRLNGAF